MKITALLIVIFLTHTSTAIAQRYTDPEGRVRVALLKQPFSPTGTSLGPNTMADGGIQKILTEMGAVIKIEEAALTPDEATEYGGWKKLSMALAHFADLVEKHERAGYLPVGLLATCPSMPGLGGSLHQAGPRREPRRIGLQGWG